MNCSEAIAHQGKKVLKNRLKNNGGKKRVKRERLAADFPIVINTIIIILLYILYIHYIYYMYYTTIIKYNKYQKALSLYFQSFEEKPVNPESIPRKSENEIDFFPEI